MSFQKSLIMLVEQSGITARIIKTTAHTLNPGVEVMQFMKAADALIYLTRQRALKETRFTVFIPLNLECGCTAHNFDDAADKISMHASSDICIHVLDEKSEHSTHMSNLTLTRCIMTFTSGPVSKEWVEEIFSPSKEQEAYEVV